MSWPISWNDINEHLNNTQSGSGSAMKDDIILNDYGLNIIEALIALGGGTRVVEIEPDIASQFWGLITPNNPPALLLVSEMLSPGEKIYTYPGAIGCDGNAEVKWLTTKMSLIYGEEVWTATTIIANDDGLYVCVTVDKTAKPEPLGD